MTPDKRAEIEAELRTIRKRMASFEVPEGLSDEEMIAWLQQVQNEARNRQPTPETALR